MNRFKKELIKRGYYTENQCPCIPYEVSSHISIQGIEINTEAATYSIYYNVIHTHLQFDRYMQPTEIKETDK